LLFSSTDEFNDRLIVAFVSANTFVCIAILNDSLVRISVKFWPQSPTGGNADANSSASSDNVGAAANEDCDAGDLDVSASEKQCSPIPLAVMSSARCGLGTAVLNGQLVAVGRFLIDRMCCVMP